MFPSFATPTPQPTTPATDDDPGSGDGGSDDFEWDFNQVLIIFGFFACNIIPFTIALTCAGRRIKRCLPSWLNIYFVGCAVMFSLFSGTVYILTTVDFGSSDMLRNYVASLAVTEFFIGFACLFGICKESYRSEVEGTMYGGGDDEQGRRRRRRRGRREGDNGELPLPTYEEAAEEKVDPEKGGETRRPSDASSLTSSSSSSSAASSTAELPTFAAAVHM